MSKARFAAAKELIDEKKYDEARALLKTIDHPTAREWEAKLDKIAPPVSYKPPEPQSFLSPQPVLPNMDTTKQADSKKKKNSRAVQGCLILILAGGIFYFSTRNTSAPEPTSSPTFTNEERASIRSTSTAEKVALLSTEVISNQTATIIALTPPTVTPTLEPSVTITDTPIPSATSTVTITPTNTKTPSPTIAPFGLKENPYPLGAPGSIRDGRLQVNAFARNQTAVVKQANMYNDDPPTGGEYVIANVTFYCDLPSSKTCNVTFMDLELTGKLGSVYKNELFVTMNTKFQGEAFGNGQISGDVAFIVNSNDSNFIFIVNDLGNRTFFATGT